jgi:electron transport complex protein RnfB
MWTGILLMTILAMVIAGVLIVANARLQSDQNAAVEKINVLLPQIQCAQCGYPGCRPYAAAIISGDADINQCAPGGAASIAALAHALDRPMKSLNSAFGETKPPAVAIINEQACIGCARCLTACPVDAIIGAPRFMHTVIASECTGCDLCLEPCPVDCITLVPAPSDAAGRNRNVTQVKTAPA